jgi:tellurite resistance protein TerC
MPQNEIVLFVLFSAFVLILLALDLGVFHRRDHAVSLKEAATWSAVWIVLSLLFNVGLYFWVEDRRGSADAMRVSLEFLTAYLLEKALSVDNIFVFVLIFNYFGVPAKFQHRVLFWGVLGALVFRLIFILAGAALISRFDWILYIFGAILVYSGWKMLRQKEIEVHPDKNPIIRLARKWFPVRTGYEDHNFFARGGDGKRHITTMFLVLITVETTDIVFAVDSIPAVFGITRDPFIVYSSNVFAILGLRALYFLLAGVMNSFYYLKHGLSIMLMFIGVKMMIEDLYHVPIGGSLGIIALVLLIAIVMSIRKNRLAAREKEFPAAR